MILNHLEVSGTGSPDFQRLLSYTLHCGDPSFAPPVHTANDTSLADCSESASVKMFMFLFEGALPWLQSFCSGGESEGQG